MPRGGRAVGIVVAFVVLIAVLYAIVGPLLGLTFGWQAYDRVTDDLRRLTGFSRYVIAALGWLAFAAVTLALFVFRPRLGRGGVAVTAAALAVVAAVYQLGLFSVTRGTNFTTDGESARYYALTRHGVVYSDRPGVDPRTGAAFLPVTPDVLPKLERFERGEFDPVDPDRVDWFNPITGEVQLWYYRRPDGTYEYYEYAGHHPGSRTPLQPVTPALKEEHEAAKRAAAAPPPPPPPVVTNAPAPAPKPARRPTVEEDRPRRDRASGPIHSY